MASHEHGLGFKSCRILIFWWIWILYSNFCLTRFGLNLIILFWTFSQLSVQFGDCRSLYWTFWFSWISQNRRDCIVCLFECWALCMTSEISLLFYVPRHQSYRIRQTFIDSDPFLDSSFNCYRYRNTYTSKHLPQFITADTCSPVLVNHLCCRRRSGYLTHFLLYSL